MAEYGVTNSGYQSLGEVITPKVTLPGNTNHGKPIAAYHLSQGASGGCYQWQIGGGDGVLNEPLDVKVDH